jgi:hypothetical protein
MRLRCSTPTPRTLACDKSIRTSVSSYKKQLKNVGGEKDMLLSLLSGCSLRPLRHDLSSMPAYFLFSFTESKFVFDLSRLHGSYERVSGYNG